MNEKQIEIISWTKEEDELLQEKYPTSTNEDLIKTFRRSLDAIRGRAHRLKIKWSGFLIQQTLKERARARWADRRASQ